MRFSELLIILVVVLLLTPESQSRRRRLHNQVQIKRITQTFSLDTSALFGIQHIPSFCSDSNNKMCKSSTGPISSNLHERPCFTGANIARNVEFRLRKEYKDLDCATELNAQLSNQVMIDDTQQNSVENYAMHYGTRMGVAVTKNNMETSSSYFKSTTKRDTVCQTLATSSDELKLKCKIIKFYMKDIQGLEGVTTVDRTQLRWSDIAEYLSKMGKSLIHEDFVNTGTSPVYRDLSCAVTKKYGPLDRSTNVLISEETWDSYSQILAALHQHLLELKKPSSQGNDCYAEFGEFLKGLSEKQRLVEACRKQDYSQLTNAQCFSEVMDNTSRVTSTKECYPRLVTTLSRFYMDIRGLKECLVYVLKEIETNSKHMLMLLIHTYLVSEDIYKTKNQVFRMVDNALGRDDDVSFDWDKFWSNKFQKMLKRNQRRRRRLQTQLI